MLKLIEMAGRELEEEDSAKMEESRMVVVVGDEEINEQDSKEVVLQKFFLQEWKLVKSLLDEIISTPRISDLSSVHKIRSIVTFLSPLLLPINHILLHYH